MSLLLKNCVFADGSHSDIKIEGQLINTIKRDIPAQENDKVIDVKGNLVTPGFVDCHTHLDKSLLLQDLPVQCMTLNDAILRTSKLKKQFTQLKVKDRARAVLDMAINNGTVAIRTNIDIDPDVGLVGVKALLQLREEYRAKIRMQLVAFPQEGINNVSGTFKLLEEALALGVDVIGGIPGRDTDPQKHTEQIFSLAQKYNLPIDMHIDETDETDQLNIVFLAHETIRRGMAGRVTAAHCCALDNLEPTILERVIKLIREAEINIVCLPSTNLFLQGRNYQKGVWRGLTPVKKLLEYDINVAFASDNIQDLFNPFGTANLLQIGLIAAQACQMGSQTELQQVYHMISAEPAKIMGVASGINPGLEANIVVLPVKNVEQAIVEQPRVLARIFSGVADI